MFTLNNPETGQLKGIVGVAVDDTIWGGDKDMQKIMHDFAVKFNIIEKGWDSAFGKNVKFLGHDVFQCTKTHEVEVDQDHYIKENVKPVDLEPKRLKLPDDTLCTKPEIKLLQGSNGTNIWVIAQTRPDAAVQVSMTAGEIGSNPTLGTVRRLNKAVACLRSRTMKIRYKRLGKTPSDFEILIFHEIGRAHV